MQLNDRSPSAIPYTPHPPRTPSGLFKHPHEFLLDDSSQTQNTGDDLEIEAHVLDLSAQPTLKLPRVSPARGPIRIV
jgi:hypothetical protein